MSRNWRIREMIRMRKETERVVDAFLKDQVLSAMRSRSTGNALWLHDSPVVTRQYIDGVMHYVICLHGYPTQTTLDRINGFCLKAFGRKMFSKKRGSIWFGEGFLREVDPKETIILPADFKPGDNNDRNDRRAVQGAAGAHHP